MSLHSLTTALSRRGWYRLAKFEPAVVIIFFSAGIVLASTPVPLVIGLISWAALLMILLTLWNLFVRFRRHGPDIPESSAATVRRARLGQLAYRAQTNPGSWSLLVSLGLAGMIRWIAMAAPSPAMVVGGLWGVYIPLLAWVSRNQETHRTRWYIGLLVLSVLGYVWAAQGLGGTLDASQTRMLLANSLWLVMISYLIHMIIRRMTVLHNRIRVVSQVSGLLRNQPIAEHFEGPHLDGHSEEYLDVVARTIGQQLGYEQVYILVHEPERDWIYLKGAFGARARDWPDQGWSADLDTQTSITGWVIRHKQSMICSDTRTCPLYYPVPGFDCRSELSSPILVDGVCVGVVDLQSHRRDDFEIADQRLLEQIADAIGAAISHQRLISHEVTRAFRSIAEVSHELALASDIDAATQRVAEKLAELSRADLVSIYHHAAGSGAPLYHPAARAGSLIDPPRFRPRMAESHVLNKILKHNRNLQPIFEPHADTSELFLGSPDGYFSEEVDPAMAGQPRYARREKVLSVAYFPLSFDEHRVASVFLNFRRRQRFSASRREILTLVSDILGSVLYLKRETQILAGPLGGQAALDHSQVQSIYAFLNAHIEYGRNWQGAVSPLTGNQVLQGNLEAFRRSWTALRIAHRAGMDTSSLRDLVATLQSIIRNHYPDARIEESISDDVEFVDAGLRNTLFKIIAEGVANALLHGEARHILVSLHREETHLALRITNDGKAIEPTVFEKQHGARESGLIAIVDAAAIWHGAEVTLAPGPDGGTVLDVLIPVLNQGEQEDD